MGCNQPIARTYFEVGGKPFCEECREAVARAFQGGSRIARFFSALLLGLIAAIVCAAGWYMVVKLTGYSIGLVAIVVGALVGFAVRKGARGRGGWPYQGMAIILTYLAIAASYVPDIIKTVEKGEAGRQSALVNSDKQRSRITILRDGTVKLNDKESSPEETVKELERLKSASGFVMYYREGRSELRPPASADIIGNKWRQLNLPVVNCSDSDCRSVDNALISFGNATFIRKLYFVVFALLFAVRIPFLSLESNAMGLLIIGFALWEAWKINKRPIINITGPHMFAPGAAMPTAGIAGPAPSSTGSATP